MRVAFVAMETVHHRDTAGVRRVDRVARSLADAGHDVTVYTARWWDGHASRHEADGVAYRAVTVHPAAPSFAAKLPYVLARDRPDVVHASAAPVSVVLAASAGATLARAPLVVEWFGDEGVPRTWLAGLAVRRADMIVTPSEMVRTAVRERGATAEGTNVIPESIDVELVRGTEPADEVDIVYASHLDESANVESLFLGLAELRGKDWSATVVGDGPWREDYERQARDLRIEDRVEFVGECDREERVARYRGAHVFVQTAKRANFATELLWALACGCVGIVEYQVNSSAHELVERQERGFRVTNTQQMADAIVESADLEHRTIDESYERYDHDAISDAYESTYERVLADYGLL